MDPKEISGLYVNNKYYKMLNSISDIRYKG